jgi:hypothetical protein
LWRLVGHAATLGARTADLIAVEEDEAVVLTLVDGDELPARKALAAASAHGQFGLLRGNFERRRSYAGGVHSVLTFCGPGPGVL